MLPAPDLLRAGNRQSRKHPQRVTRNRGGSPRSRSVPLSPSSRIYAARVSRDVIPNVRPSCGVLRGVLPCCRACVSHSSAGDEPRHARTFPHFSAHPASPNTAHAFAFLSLRLSARAISERFARRTCLHVRARASAFAPASLFRGKVAFLLLCRLIPRQALSIDFRARSARYR